MMAAEMQAELEHGAMLFSRMWNAPVPRVAVENPVMHGHAKRLIQNYQEPAQSVQPWQFGDLETKRTCFWLRGLPALVPDTVIKPDGVIARVHRMPPGPDRGKERSRFFPGIARAMAEQWGGYALQQINAAKGAVMHKPLKITKDELLALKPCDPYARVKLFGRCKDMDVARALKAGVSIRDILWVAGRLGRKDLCIKFALACAVHVEKLDKTGTAKPCNDATAAYAADPSLANLETLFTKRRAAADAADAADAAAAPAARNKEIAWQKQKLIQIFGGRK